MVNPQLLDYIKQQLEAGYDKQDVKQALLDVGWGEQEINEAFDFYFTSGHLPQQPPTQQPITPSQTPPVFLYSTKLLDYAWALYKQRFWTLIAIALIPTLSIITTAIGSSWVSAFIFSKIISGGFLLPLLIFALATLAMFLVQLWGQAALLFAIVNHKERIGFVESYRRGWHKILSLGWIIILMVFVTLGGYLLAIIPGVIFTIWFSLSAIVLIAEDSRGMNALLKSREYVRGRWWGVLGRNIFISLIIGLLSLIFIIPTLIFLFIFKAPVVLQAAYFIVQITWTPLFLAYSFLIYQNLRSLRGEIDLATTRKSRTTFFVIAILGIVAILALFFWMIFPTFSTLRQLGKTPSIGSYSPTISPSTDETANWQTYHLETFGWDFKYPPGFEVIEKETKTKGATLLYIAKSKIEFYDIGSDNAFFKIIVNNPNYYSKDLSRLKNPQISSIWLGDRFFSQVRGDDYGRYEGDSAGKIIDILIGLDSTIHIEERPGNQTLDFDVIKTADQILSTFKFIQ